MLRRSFRARPRPAAALGLRFCATSSTSAAPSESEAHDVSDHYTGGFRANFKRCESDHEALADVIAAAKDQRGAPPITTMGSVAPALNATLHGGFAQRAGPLRLDA